MKWKKNLLSINKYGNVGSCPYCDSDNTDYMYYKFPDGRGCIDVWCNVCNERVHVDCRFIPDNRKCTLVHLVDDLGKKDHEIAI